MLEAERVQLVGGDVQQGGHLVDKGPGAPGAGAVHPLLQPAGQENDFGILAAQLHHHVGVGDESLHRPRGGKNLLNEGDAGGVCHPQAGGAGDRHLYLLPAQGIGQPLQHLGGLLPHLGHVPLVGFEYGPVAVVQHHHLDGGGADVDSNTQSMCLLL